MVEMVKERKLVFDKELLLNDKDIMDELKSIEPGSGGEWVELCNGLPVTMVDKEMGVVQVAGRTFYISTAWMKEVDA